MMLPKVALVLSTLVCAGAARAQPTETMLYSFEKSGPGRYPAGTLVFDGAGALYGAMSSGGVANAGAVIELTPGSPGALWTETRLVGFDGSIPSAFPPSGGLVFDAGGALYGATYGGGASGAGAVFKLAPPQSAGAAWAESVLYSFGGTGDGTNPTGGLIVDAGGALYGTIMSGGASGTGTVFKLTPPAAGQTQWTETLLYQFRASYRDGAQPRAGLVADATGALYGTTVAGGAAGYGTVFRLTPPAAGQTRWSETLLYQFQGPPGDGGRPMSGLVADRSGALYGTTYFGGGGHGTVFQLAPPPEAGGAWRETVLHSFRGAPDDGRNPLAGLTLEASGSIDGTTTMGGASDNGTVFRLAAPAAGQTQWTESLLHAFGGGTDGLSPGAGSLVVDAGGALYGTTVYGGTRNFGTVFKLQ